MSVRLIDTHCHLDSDGFQHDVDEVIQRAIDAGVDRMLTLGVSVASSRKAIALAERFPAVWAAVGIHPNYVQDSVAGDWEQIEQLAEHPRVVAIGETGLDQYWDTAPLELQKDFFLRHIRLSQRISKPFAVHCRDAEQPVLDVLAEAQQGGLLSGVMHSFCGTTETATNCLAAGLHISLAGMLTYRKNEDLRAMALTVPLDRVMVETDAPYLAPQPNRGKRNEPAWVRHTAECLAGVHSLSLEEIGELTTRNALRLFWNQRAL
jgi:TatD DNase family protein